MFDSGHGYYSSRLSIHLNTLPNGSYTMAFELIWTSNDIDLSSVSINGQAAVETIHNTSCKVFNDHSRLILQFTKSSNANRNHLYIDIIIKLKIAKYPQQLQTYIVVYGVIGLQSDVSQDVYDAFWSINNGKVTFNETIDMDNNIIQNLKDSQPSDVSHAASVGYVEKRIKEYEELSIESVVKMNVFKNVMENNLFKQGNGINIISQINYRLLHKINQKTYLMQIS